MAPKDRGAGQPPAGVVEPALGLLEFDSIAVGIEAGDAMAKRAPIDVIRAGTVHPGRFLVLVGGAVADVEEAMDAGREVGSTVLLDAVLLPHVHPDVVDALGGRRRKPVGEALGVIETGTVAAIIEAADAGLKGARVALLELRLADDLGGKGYLLFDGPVAEVEAAVEIGAGRIAASPNVFQRVIPQLHAEMSENLAADARFGRRVRGVGAGAPGEPGVPDAPGAAGEPDAKGGR
jgi:microcompartment protein CcmL/EutN